MKKQPKISIIIPVYNVGKYLRQCLTSVVNQTLKDIEIICVNDGSTDDSLAILQEYAKKDDRIKIINKEKSSGAGDSRNQGMNIAKGEYLWFVDSDDWAELNTCEEVYKHASDYSADIVIFGAKIFNNKDKSISVQNMNLDIIPTKIFNSKNIPDKIFQICIPTVWDKVFKKDFVQKNNIYFQNLSSSNDIGFVQICMGTASKITYIDKCYYFYRINTGKNISSTRGKKIDNSIIASQFIVEQLKKSQLFDILSESFYYWCVCNFHYEYTLFSPNDKDLFLKKIKTFLPQNIYEYKFPNVKNYYSSRFIKLIKITEGHVIYSIFGAKLKLKKNNKFLKILSSFKDISI